MRFDQIKKLTKRQRIFNGIIILTEDFGLCYVLPAPYDEIADSIENIAGWNLRIRLFFLAS